MSDGTRRYYVDPPGICRYCEEERDLVRAHPNSAQLTVCRPCRSQLHEQGGLPSIGSD